MGISLVYDRANKDAYDMLQAAQGNVTGDQLASLITTKIFPTILKKVGDTIIRPEIVDRNYDHFKIPLSEFGAITEYLISTMIKADDPTPIETGTRVDDFVINNPDIRGSYALDNIHANYALTVNSDRWLDAIDNHNTSALASMIGIAMQALYDGIAHDHDSFIPALFGPLYGKVLATSKRTIPRYTGANLEQYSKEIFATLNKAIRDMTTWRRKDFNYLGGEMSDSKDDIVLVAFENNVTGRDQTVLDIITSQLNIGPTARAKALGESLGIRVYEMPTMGVINSSVARAYALTNLPGMQTANTATGTYTIPYPDVKFALVGRGALNVGLKRLQTDSGRSIRGHFDQTWVQPTLQLSYGAGQVIFFSDPVVEEEDGE